MNDSQLRLGSIVTRSTSRARMVLISFDVLDRSMVLSARLSIASPGANLVPSASPYEPLAVVYNCNVVELSH